MTFPLPSLLASIEDLLVEVACLDGMILVTESQTANFLPIAQVNPVLDRLRSRPRGAEVADKLSLSLLKSQGKQSSKPVLFVQGSGRFWLGIISSSVSRSRSCSSQQHAVAHLDRCFAKG